MRSNPSTYFIFLGKFLLQLRFWILKSGLKKQLLQVENQVLKKHLLQVRIQVLKNTCSRYCILFRDSKFEKIPAQGFMFWKTPGPGRDSSFENNTCSNYTGIQVLKNTCFKWRIRFWKTPVPGREKHRFRKEFKTNFIWNPKSCHLECQTVILYYPATDWPS